jgi:AraC family L-rhamnose operon transcriptional activator RhaR
MLEEATVALSHQSAALRLALDMLVLDVIRTVSQPIDARSSVARHPAVLRAIHLLESRFSEPWTLNEIAEHVGISRAHLAKLFQQDTGIPMHKFLNRVRISRAEQLLRNSELSCESIAVVRLWYQPAFFTCLQTSRRSHPNPFPQEASTARGTHRR